MISQLSGCRWSFGIALLALVSLMITAPAAKTSRRTAKQRLFVLSDVLNEPDDTETFVRCLVYNNEFEIEGLCVNTSDWLRTQTFRENFVKIINTYGEVLPNLELHDDGWHEPDYLRSVCKSGIGVWGNNGVGRDEYDSDASNLLEQVMLKDDDRPLWVTMWGGGNSFAQALWSIKTHHADKLDEVVSKLRCYGISDQDNSEYSMRQDYPGLFFIITPGSPHVWMEWNCAGNCYNFATWSGISGDEGCHCVWTGRAPSNIVRNAWLATHITNNHGSLGAEYPPLACLMEGDTPTILHLFPFGLGEPDCPDWGGWGGRYELYIPEQHLWDYGAESRAIWTNADDRVLGMDGNYYTDNHATIWRWRLAYQYDFVARMDWCVKTYAQANHPPQADSLEPVKIIMSPGDNVTLSAADFEDPDGDQLHFNWFHYKEAGGNQHMAMGGIDDIPAYDGDITISSPSAQEITVTAPTPTTVSEAHIILEVTDNSKGFGWDSQWNGTGSPPMYRYRRYILTLVPAQAPPTVTDDSYRALPGATLQVSAAKGVLANDLDPNLDDMTATLVDDVSHGTLTLNENGSFEYAPEAGYEGSDQFTYKANDGTAGSASAATVSITVGGIHIKINCGGAATGDWESDAAYAVGGSTYPWEASGVYATVRRATPHGYSFDVPNGTYMVTIHLIDKVAAGTRSFTYSAEGQEKLTGINTTAEPTTAEFEVEVSDGNGLQLNCVGVGDVFEAAMEVEAVASVAIRPAHRTDVAVSGVRIRYVKYRWELFVPYAGQHVAEILSLNGSVVDSFRGDGPTRHVIRAGLASGTYMVRVSADGVRVTRRLVLSR